MATRWDGGGFDKFRKKFEKLDGKHKVPLKDLFHPGYMRLNTKFKTIDDMLEASVVQVDSPDDLNNNEPWDAFVAANTHYSSWREMLKAAIANWTKQQLK
jgi:hypothetical protein